MYLRRSGPFFFQTRHPQRRFRVMDEDGLESRRVDDRWGRKSVGSWVDIAVGTSGKQQYGRWKIACKARKSAMNSSKVVDGGMLICLFQRKHVDLLQPFLHVWVLMFIHFNHGLFQMILQGFARIFPKKTITPGKSSPKISRWNILN